MSYTLDWIVQHPNEAFVIWVCGIITFALIAFFRYLSNE